MQLATPITATSFPGYEKLEPLGSGSQGAVFSALESRWGRPVAIKTLRPEADPLALKREFACCASSTIQNLVELYELHADC